MSVTYEQISLAAYDNALFTKKLATNDLEIVDENIILIKGIPVKLKGYIAYGSLLKAIGINKQLLKHLGSVAPEMVQGYLLKLQRNKKTPYIYVVMDKFNNIVKFTRFASEVMPPQVYLSLINRIMNDNPNLSIKGLAIASHVLTLSIEDALTESNLFGLSGGDKGREIFTFGTAIRTGIDTPLEFLQHVNRLWCSNGCVSEIESQTMKMSKVTTNSIHKFLEKFDEFKGVNYGVASFQSHMQRATQTQASIHEVLRAHKQIQEYLGEGAGYRELPIAHIYNDYAREGINVDELSFAQTKTCPTNYRVWDVFNTLTDIASNTDAENANVDMQISAGRLLTSPNDIENIVGVNPYKRLL